MTDFALSPTRRAVLAAVAATVTLPMLDAAVGAARAAPGGPNAPAATEKPGWFATTLKAADLKDNEFTAVTGHALLLSRAGKTVIAVSSTCTHKGCALSPKAGSKILGPCRCHQAQFNLDGTVAKGPATVPLPQYALRVNDKGLIEIDPGQKVSKDDRLASVTIS